MASDRERLAEKLAAAEAEWSEGKLDTMLVFKDIESCWACLAARKAAWDEFRAARNITKKEK